MLNFDYCSPTRFIFGKDTENRTGELLREYAPKKLLLHYGMNSVKKSGLLDNIKKQLEAENIDYIELGGVKPNPVDSMVYKGIELCRKEKVDFILAIGGGSAIDSAKAIAMGVYYEGDFWEAFANRIPAKKALPLATVLTIPATGTEASAATVITKEEGKLKYGYHSQLLKPVFSIMNPELTFTLPPYQTACGISDMCTHICERYFSNTPETGLTDSLCEAVLKTIIAYAPRVFANPEDYEARANIMWAGTLAHNDSLGLDREQDWSTHAIEHELSAIYDVAHGAGLAVILPAFMLYTVDHDINRYAAFAHNIFGIQPNFRNLKETALKGIKAYKDFMRSIGLPTDLEALGADPADIPAMVPRVRRNNGDKLGRFLPLGPDDIRAILELAAIKD